MGPAALAQVLRPLATLFPAADYPDLLVGLEDPDDAAVFRRDEHEALVVTTDFFPPVVDDAYAFGAIAAANAMSDVFAMGADVLLALNIAGFPADLPPEVAAEIIRGGAEKVAEAGGVLAGGHTVSGPEPLYGLAVVGCVHPERVLRKAGARPGDRLVLTKPLGTGVVTTALKRGQAAAVDVAIATSVMTALNRVAGRAAHESGATAVTDVTGFGLAGHAIEVAERSAVALHVRVDRLPVLPNALGYAEAGHVPGGTFNNRDAYAGRMNGLETLPTSWQDLVLDPQTSGGLLVALPQERLAEYIAMLGANGIEGHEIGSVAAGSGLHLSIA